MPRPKPLDKVVCDGMITAMLGHSASRLWSLQLEGDYEWSEYWKQ